MHSRTRTNKQSHAHRHRHRNTHTHTHTHTHTDTDTDTHTHTHTHTHTQTHTHEHVSSGTRKWRSRRWRGRSGGSFLGLFAALLFLDADSLEAGDLVDGADDERQRFGGHARGAAKSLTSLWAEGEDVREPAVEVREKLLRRWRTSVEGGVRGEEERKRE